MTVLLSNAPEGEGVFSACYSLQCLHLPATCTSAALPQTLLRHVKALQHAWRTCAQEHTEEHLSRCNFGL